MGTAQISTYIINLSRRKDRKRYITKQFFGRSEFKPILVKATEHTIGAVGLWNSIRGIIQDALKTDEAYIIICEDDHQFTSDYSKELLRSLILDGLKLNADILCGGVSWFSGVIKASNGLYWLERFSGTQFLVVYRSFFQTILDAEFLPTDNADYKICELSRKRFLIVPYISFQNDFGYSDATSKNDTHGIVTELFKNSSSCITLLEKLSAFYSSSLAKYCTSLPSNEINNLFIPTYLLSLPNFRQSDQQLIEQFQGKPEFLVTTVETVKNDNSKTNLWSTLRVAIKLAIANEDDLAVVCWGNHKFTNLYNRSTFITGILKAHILNADILFGGAQEFDLALQPTQELVWTNKCVFSTFVVFFKKMFVNIVDYQAADSRDLNEILAEISLNKFIFSPFISTEIDADFSEDSRKVTCDNKLESCKLGKSSARISILYETFSCLNNGVT